MEESNPQQQRLADLPIANVLVTAPAGCGKTEALAVRAREVLARGEITLPQKILALTFSNKARDNMASRMQEVVGPSWRRRITVTNFHGLAARIIKAHAAALQMTPDLILPEEPWRRRQLHDLGVDDYARNGPFEEALHVAKFGRYSDDEVMDQLEAIGNPAAIAFEQRLRADGRLDYDDLIRHGGRLLEIAAIGRLYRSHFGMVMVDEIQDMSLLQYDIVRAVGDDRVTYAGDLAQGIYSFAGADPVGVFERVHALAPEIVEFNLSYRSAPAVLRSVNALAAEMGTTQLECGAPERWKDEGHVISLEREDTDEEAAAVLDLIEKILRDPQVTVGVVGRRGTRSKAIRDAVDQAGVPFEDWSTPTHVPAVVELINRTSEDALNIGGTDEEVLNILEELCRESVDPADANTLDELANACDALRYVVGEGATAAGAIASCRPSATPGTAVTPGLHLLTGHKGKGQEFDWVFVVGLEQGHIPDFRSTTDEAVAEELRVLHVMVSRARYGVVVTHSRYTPSKSGWWKAVPSPWLQLLRDTATSIDHK